jgi:hypothetical protein
MCLLNFYWYLLILKGLKKLLANAFKKKDVDGNSKEEKLLNE